MQKPRIRDHHDAEFAAVLRECAEEMIARELAELEQLYRESGATTRAGVRLEVIRGGRHD